MRASLKYFRISNGDSIVQRARSVRSLFPMDFYPRFVAVTLVIRNGIYGNLHNAREDRVIVKSSTVVNRFI